MTETTQKKTKGIFKRISHKVQKILRINKTKKELDLDDVIMVQHYVDEPTMSKLAHSIKILDKVVEDIVVVEEPTTRSELVRTIKMPNLLAEEVLCKEEDVCKIEIFDDHDDLCDHEVCFLELTIMNVSGANGKKPTYTVTNTCRRAKFK